MSNQYGLFFNSVEHDRLYDADSFSEWLYKFFTTGVFNGDLFVEADTGMRVKLNSGYVNVKGKVRFFDEPETFTLAPASGTYPRIDTIVIECNYSDREIYAKVVQGQYSGQNPVPTEPVRTNAVYQLVVAQIRVDAGETEILQSMITDTRPDSELCGWVTGTVEEVPFDQFTAQFRAYFAEFRANNLEEFEEWFDTIKGQLDGDIAGNLQNQINDIDDTIDEIEVRMTEIDTAITNAQIDLITEE